jgi:AraC family transcriptional regulator of adaptative response / DNA-3-methyladenine glycosylase II
VELNRDICRNARLSRDARFDGKFFIAVRTTRIFCRPVCPARSPKEENVSALPSRKLGHADVGWNLDYRRARSSADR